MSETPAIPRCKVCGEETTHNTASSFFGHVHRWGPTDHDFMPDSPLPEAPATR
jgi:hypothetical protein